ncbi:polyprenyl synthetase family protein, partial [Candidatus Aminicenantes bacterium AC-335-A11]|nr:polyprenyl synthetase family protein [Candidatus Aminicenantes bacterium AC-335-A11]
FSGGKRFRALLTLCSGESLGAKERELLPYACAIELIHNYSLIHDDLPSMDNDDFRRGKPTLHKVYDEGIALLAGDALLTLSFQILSSLSQPFTLEIINLISKAAGIEGMINGQALDLTLDRTRENESTFLDLSFKKTAYLIIAAVKTGGIVAKAERKKMDALEIYGKNLGIAYQIIDDILDMEEEKNTKRLNYALLVGEKKAKEKALELEREALTALRKAGIDSPCLEYLLNKAVHRER